MKSRMKTGFRISLVAVALIAATACGFHLRNSASLPSALSPMYIGGSEGNSALGRKVRYHLTNASTEVTPYSAQAAYQLILEKADQEQRIISLDRRGLAAEYGLTRSIEFELRDKQNRRVLGPLTVEERRTVTNNPDNALTTSQDIGIIAADMDQTIAMQIVRRLGAYATHKLPAEQTKGSDDNSATATPTSGNAPATAAPQN